MSAPCILVVDDDESVREILTIVLGAEGYEVIAVPHGQAALDLVSSGITPRLVILDLMMPVMDGWRFLDSFKASAMRDVPIVIFSASGVRAAQMRDDVKVLPKPVDRDVLLRVVAEATGRTQDA